MTILDRSGSRIASIDVVDNPSHGEQYADEGELCLLAPKDGTTTCHRYCTAYVVSNGKPVTLAMTYVRNDEDEADAVDCVLARVENYPLEIDLLLADSGFYNERVNRRARDIAATVVHVPKKGERMKEKLDTHESYMTAYRMYKDSERELRFPLAVAVFTRMEIGASTAKLFVATSRAALLIARRSRSNGSTGSGQASKRPIASRGKHAGSRVVVIPSCYLQACWSQHCWRTCGSY